MSLRSVCFFLLAFVEVISAQSQPEQPATGVTSNAQASSQSALTPAGWEKRTQDGIVPDNIRENMRRLSARPHHVGSPYDKDNAEWILARFKEWGFDAQIETFDVLFPTPKERVVELLEPTKFEAKLQEPALASIPRRTRRRNSFPPTTPTPSMAT